MELAECLERLQMLRFLIVPPITRPDGNSYI